MNIDNQNYSIGAVAKLSGLSTHTIRKWEDRYQLVEPGRSSGGDRRYSSADVARLTLLKELVDSGQAISKIADLDDDELRGRCNASLSRDIAQQATRAIRMAVLGDSLATIIRHHQAIMPNLLLAHTSLDISDIPTQTIDVVLLERPGLAESVFDDIQRVQSRVPGVPIVVMYGFGPQAIATRLSTEKTACLRMPVNYRELQRLIMAMVSERANDHIGSFEPPPHRYSRHVLARVASISPTLACECPRHVAELIFALSDFESYSAECESQNPQDAIIHNYLRLTAAHARALFEKALTTVADHENIPLQNWESAAQETKPAD